MDPLYTCFVAIAINLHSVLSKNLGDVSYIISHLQACYLIPDPSITKFTCVSECVSICLSVRNRLPNHAYYGDEAFAVDSVGLGLGQRLKFIKKKLF